MAKKKSDDPSRELVDSVHKVWLAGLGALSAAEEEGAKLFDSLVEKGRALEKRREESVDRLRENLRDTAESAKKQATAAREKVGSSIDEQVTRALGRLGVPSRNEIAELTARVEALTAAVERLRAPQEPAPKKKPAPKRTGASKSKKPN